MYGRPREASLWRKVRGRPLRDAPMKPKRDALARLS